MFKNEWTIQSQNLAKVDKLLNDVFVFDDK